MTRRADPERIYQARRAATFHRLADVDRLDELHAEHWIARWEREAELLRVGRYSSEFWSDGGVWIKDQRRAKRRS
jgi:hypothetical protein